MSGAKRVLFFLPLFRFSLSRSSLVWGLWGNIYSLDGRDGSISGGMNTLKVEEGGNSDGTNLRSVIVICRHLLIHLSFSPFLLFFKTLSKLFFLLRRNAFWSLCLLLGAPFENSIISGPTYYPSTTHLPTYYRTWGICCASWNICRSTFHADLCRELGLVGGAVGSWVLTSIWI